MLSYLIVEIKLGINELEEQIVEVEVNKTIGKGNKRLLDITINKLYQELESKNNLYATVENEFAELTGKKKVEYRRPSEWIISRLSNSFVFTK